MAVRLRLLGRGRKKYRRFDIVAADGRAPRDGRFIEKVGIYNPKTHPATVELNFEAALKWIMNGAQPTDTVKSILSREGVMFRKHLQVGVNKGAITQEVADQRFNEWLNKKQADADKTVASMASKKVADAKARLEAEAAVKLKKAEAIQAKLKVEEPAAEEVADETATEEAPVAEAPAAEAETPADETPAAE